VYSADLGILMKYKKCEQTLEAQEMLKRVEKDLKALKGNKDKVIIEKKTLEEDYISMKGKYFKLPSRKRLFGNWFSLPTVALP
jgi:Sec7-like guanine-nucleotide exchange factor